MENSERRCIIPAKIMELLWQDSEFFDEVANSKKASLRVYPKYDHWYDSQGFHMEFALAGFSSKDVSVEVCGNELVVQSMGIESPTESENLVRGIARRKFRNKFLVIPDLDLEQIKSKMDRGLLRIDIPSKTESPLIKTVAVTAE